MSARIRLGFYRTGFVVIGIGLRLILSLWDIRTTVVYLNVRNVLIKFVITSPQKSSNKVVSQFTLDIA